jgi:peptide-methionine (S)-S-oxide reductase
VQKAVAEEVIARITAEKLYRDPVVTRVEPVSTFYIAEDYHQEYFARNPYQGYRRFVVALKVAKFRKQFFDG